MSSQSDRNQKKFTHTAFTGACTASAIALSVGLMPTPATAVEFEYGEMQGFLDTIVSAGASMRTAKRNCENISKANGGCQSFDASGLDKSSAGVSSDDGNLNYDQWDVFSGTMKATSELQLNWRNFTGFVRGSAFYDPLVADVDFRELESPQRSEVERSAKLFDYFIAGNFEVGGLPLDIKLGNQVISWGESTFIQNGINVINPIDVSAARKPGSEIKEFFEPILAAHFALGLPNNFAVEGFYQFKSANVVPDPAGTFFSSADIVGRGSQPIRAGISDFGDDDRFNPFIIPLQNTDTVWDTRLAVNVPSVSIERADDVNADDGGEFGVALRYYAEELNQGTEFGLYFMNYHSRLPILNLNRSNPGAAFSVSSGTNIGVLAPLLGTGTGPGGTAVDAFEVSQTLCNALAPVGGLLAARGMGSANASALGTNAAVNLAAAGGYTNCNNIARLRNGVAASLDRATAALIGNTGQFRLEYPEDIQMLGLSISTTVGPIAVQGEFTYRHDAPFATVGSELGALSNDLDGQTAFRTGATSLQGNTVADPAGRFDPADPQNGNMVAARTGQMTFLQVVAAEEALLGLAPGTISGALAPSAAGTGVDTASADAAAALGQFVTLDTQFNPGGVIGVAGADGASAATGVFNASPADVAFLTHANVATPQVRSSSLDPSRFGGPGSFASIAKEDVFTAQTTLTSILFASNPFVTAMGADQGVLITEIGMVYLPSISAEDALSASGSSGLLNGLAAGTYKLSAELESATHYATKFSWGAQGRIGLTYNRAFGTPINLSPVFNWRWDFNGRTPSPFSNYQEDRKSISLGVNASYLASWAGSISWTHNFGPDAPLDDRDFASINISYAF